MLRGGDEISGSLISSQRTLTMFVGVVALCYQCHWCVVLITECHNSHKHSQSSLTN